jgi:hypothetical protein
MQHYSIEGEKGGLGGGAGRRREVISSCCLHLSHATLPVSLLHTLHFLWRLLPLSCCGRPGGPGGALGGRRRGLQRGGLLKEERLGERGKAKPLKHILRRLWALQGLWAVYKTYLSEHLFSIRNMVTSLQ